MSACASKSSTVIPPNAASTVVAQFLQTFEEYPPRQKAATFTIDQALEKMADAATGGRG